MNIRETVTQWLIDASTWESEHKIENLVAGLREDVTYPLDTTCTNKVVYIVQLLTFHWQVVLLGEGFQSALVGQEAEFYIDGSLADAGM